MSSVYWENSSRVSYSRRGKPGGLPVLFLHGWFTSQHEQFASDSLLEEHGLDWFTLNRPGYGRSAWNSRDTFRDWAQRVDIWANALSLDQFHIMGFSGGGPYAMACAHFLPQRVVTLTLIGSLAPFHPGHCPQRAPWGLAGGWLLRHSPSVGEWLFRALDPIRRWRPKDFEDWQTRAMHPADQAIWQVPGRLAMREAAHAEAFAQGARHIVSDLRLSALPWDFDARAIRCPTVIHVGAEDLQVPPQASRWLAAQIPGARLLEYPQQGHYLHFANAREVLREIVIP